MENYQKRDAFLKLSLKELRAEPVIINGIHIGQTFYTKIGKNKIKSEVVDFIKTYSMTTGEVISIKILAKVYGFSSENTWETNFEDVLNKQ